MRSFIQIILVFIGAFISGGIIGAEHWHQVSSEVAISLSIICTAVLIRLARAMPITDIEYLKIQEAEKLANAFLEVSKRLRVAFWVSFITLLLVAFNGTIFQTLNKLEAIWVEDISKIISALIGIAMVFTYIKVFDLVNGDVDLIKLQKKIMLEKIVHRDTQIEMSRLTKAKENMPLEVPSNYGKKIN